MEQLLFVLRARAIAFAPFYADFAQRFAKIAGHLLSANERSDDPNIEQIVQAMAMLDACIEKKLKVIIHICPRTPLLRERL